MIIHTVSETENLKIKIPIFKPKQQSSPALNTLFVTNNKEAQYYTMTYRVVTSTLLDGKRSHIENDIFNGSVPVCLLFIHRKLILMEQELEMYFLFLGIITEVLKSM